MCNPARCDSGLPQGGLCCGYGQGTGFCLILPHSFQRGGGRAGIKRLPALEWSIRGVQDDRVPAVYTRFSVERLEQAFLGVRLAGELLGDLGGIGLRDAMSRKPVPIPVIIMLICQLVCEVMEGVFT